MNDEHFEEINDIVFPTPSKIASVLNIDEKLPTVRQVRRQNWKRPVKFSNIAKPINAATTIKSNLSLVIVVIDDQFSRVWPPDFYMTPKYSMK